MRGVVIFILAFAAVGLVLFTPVWYRQKLRRAPYMAAEELRPLVLILLVQFGRLCTSQLSTMLNRSISDLDPILNDLAERHLVKKDGEAIPQFKEHVWGPVA